MSSVLDSTGHSVGIFKSAGAWELRAENLELNLNQFQFQLRHFRAHTYVTLNKLLFSLSLLISKVECKSSYIIELP